MKKYTRNSLWVIGVGAGIILINFLIVSVMGYSMFRGLPVEENAVDETEDLTVIGFSQIGSESVWRTTNTASIQQAFSKENGYFLIFSNARQKQENQIKAIRSFISQRVDYIVFSPVTEEGWDTVLQEAKDAGIPVIVVDRMVDVEDDSLYTAWVGSDTRREGELAGEWLEEYMEAQGRADELLNIVVLQGTPGSTAQLGRTRGFNQAVIEHENWQIIDQESGDFTTAKGQEIMRSFLQKYEDIDVVVSQNDDMTFGAIKAIEAAGLTTGVDGDIILISFDAVGEALEMVEAGIINVDIECNPEQGEYITAVIEKLERGETIEKYNYVEEAVFTQDNVSAALPYRTY